MDKYEVFVQEDLQRKIDNQFERIVTSEFLAGPSWTHSLSKNNCLVSILLR